jgi:solute:Na+ symporter, SSS family
MPVRDLFVFMFTLGGYQIVRQDTWQRIWAAGDMKIAARGFWISTIFSLIVTAAIFSLGTFGRLIGVAVEDPSLAFYAISSSVLPTYGLVIVITGLMATIISAADSNLVAGASSVVNDIIKPFLKTHDQRILIQSSRYAVLITSIISLFLAIYIPRLIELWVTGTAMLTSGLLIPVLAALFWKKATNTGGVTAIWGGLITAVLWQLLGHPFGLHPVYIGLPVSLILIVTVSLKTTATAPDIVESLLYNNNKS